MVMKINQSLCFVAKEKACGTQFQDFSMNQSPSGAMLTVAGGAYRAGWERRMSVFDIQNEGSLFGVK